MEVHIGFILFSVIFVFIYTFGCYNFLTNYEENRCNMTYMFEYPKLIRVSLPSDVTNSYKKYGLYAYGEGRFIEPVRDMKFTGIPVLFIPGNRGSPKQVRSLASVSLRKAVGSRIPYHFDYFAVDLNEDYSGIFGGFLNDQTKFVNICIKKIISLYPSKSIKSVVLIGHSMGGVIAKGLFLEPDFNYGSVKLIITLAAPHSPALLLDSLTASYYNRINNFWDNNSTLKQNLNLISIGGGPRDLLVKSSLTSTPHADINIITTSIRDVWLSVDHLCILWCKELILVIARALFDCIDIKTNMISENVTFRRDIFKYHLIERSGSKKYHPLLHPEELILWNGIKYGSKWIPMIGNQMDWSELNGIPLPTYISVSLATASDTLAIQTKNHKTNDWIFACIVDITINNMRVCKKGINLSNKGKISPNVGLKRKFALIDLSKLRMKGFTHVIVRTLPSSQHVHISLDLFKKKQRTIIGSANYLFSNTILDKNEPGSMYYSIEIPGLQAIWQAYELFIESSNCSLPLLAEVAVNMPWNNGGSNNIISGSEGSVPLIVHSSKNADDSSNVQVDLLLNPQCVYEVRLQRSIPHSLGAIFGKHGVNVFPLITVCLLLTLSFQIKQLEERSTCPLLQVAMPLSAKPYIIIQASAILSAILQQASNYFSFIPPVDSKGQTGFMELLIIPVFLYMTAFALTFVIGTAFLLAVIFQGHAFNGIILRFLNKFCMGLSWVSEYVLNCANKLPIIVAVLMLFIANSACGGLALSVGLCFYFFKMVTLYEDFWEEIIFWPLRVLKIKLKEYKEKKKMEIPLLQIPQIKDISFHLTLIVLWAVAVTINIPTVLVWAKQYRYSSKLQPDPGFLNSAIMSICAGVLWQTDTPKTGLILSKPLSHIIFLLAVFIMVYGQTSIYRISFVIAIVFVLITLHQVIAPWFTPDDEIPELVEDSVENFHLECKIAEILEGSLLDRSEIDADLPELIPEKEEEIEEEVGEEEEEEELQQQNDESDSEEKVEHNQDKVKTDRVKGEETPSDASSSSFEQISDKDIT